MYELSDGAAEALSRVEMPVNWNAEQHTEPMTAVRLRSLYECLGEVAECRHARGKRYPLKTVLAIAVAARLAGYRGANAFAQFAALLNQE
ncbi:MAG: transposase family protein [Deltaproteobacteria bacterium]|nr:transposase family protein [Deltaproteobacteria bacterium]